MHYRCLFIIKILLQALNCNKNVNMEKQLYYSEYIRKTLFENPLVQISKICTYHMHV